MIDLYTWTTPNGRIIGVLADRIVRRNLQFLDIRADHHWALVGGNISVGKTEAIDVQIAVAEFLFFSSLNAFNADSSFALRASMARSIIAFPSAGDAS